MSELFKICIHHGELKKEDIGLHSHTQRKKVRIYCKICQRERDAKKRDLIREMKKNNPDSFNSKKIKICFIHGDLLQKDIFIDSYGKPMCKICKREASKLSDLKWRNKNPESQRRNNLKIAYGITLEQYNNMLIEQNHVCYICKQPEILYRRGQLRPLAVDHCHDSEKLGIMYVRKLLCSKCNSALALVCENVDISRSMTNYIETICKKPTQ